MMDIKLIQVNLRENAYWFDPPRAFFGVINPSHLR